ncbi:MAG: hypothetical protein M0P13_03005 [Fibrobacteraceae bacterium]|nr:hypothetical protein [Fibrobacteraceae bacterium]
MSISILKAKWNEDLEAFVAKIDGKTFVLDLPKCKCDGKCECGKCKGKEKNKLSTKVMKKNAAALKVLTNVKSAEKKRKSNPVKDLIATGAPFESVSKKYPKLSRISYYQYRNRLGLTKHRK